MDISKSATKPLLLHGLFTSTESFHLWYCVKFILEGNKLPEFERLDFKIT